MSYRIMIYKKNPKNKVKKILSAEHNWTSQWRKRPNAMD